MMPARMKANGTFSDASVILFYSGRINFMMNPHDLFEFQVAH